MIEPKKTLSWLNKRQTQQNIFMKSTQWIHTIAHAQDYSLQSKIYISLFHIQSPIHTWTTTRVATKSNSAFIQIHQTMDTYGVQIFWIQCTIMHSISKREFYATKAFSPNNIHWEFTLSLKHREFILSLNIIQRVLSNFSLQTTSKISFQSSNDNKFSQYWTT